MKLIVGLGNYQDVYKNTRHNVGYMILDYIVSHYNQSYEFMDSVKYNDIKEASNQYAKEKFNNFIPVLGDNTIGYFCNYNGNLYFKPALGMNDSGIPVNLIKKIFKKLGIDNDDILVVVDDMDLQLGDLRLKAVSKTHHNGIKSIMNELKLDKINLLRIGIGKPNKDIKVLDYVLSDFTDEEKNIITSIYPIALDYVKKFISVGLEKAVNVINNNKGVNE